MPQYKVIAPGVYNNIMYSPEHPRRHVLRTDKPFPVGKKFPSWLKPIKDETAAQKKARENLEKDQDQAIADKAEDDQNEIDSVTFVAGSVETL